MSVINNVLKDLETRESEFIPIEIESVGQSPVPARDLKPLLLVAVLLLLLMAAAWIYLQDRLIHNKISSTAPTLSNTTDASVSTLQPAVESEPIEGVVTDQMIGNQIIGLQIRESEDDMRMEFVLREKVVAYLKERGENKFGYHLRNIESQIVAPVITDNRWIQELSIMSTEAGVDINFQTAANILVETRQNLVDGESVWAIDLRKSVVPVGAVTAAPAAVELQPDSESTLVISETEIANTTSLEIAKTDQVETQPAMVKIDIKSINPNTKSINQLEYAVELINSRRLSEAETLLQGLLTGVEDYNARKHLLALYSRQKRDDRFRRLVSESMAAYPDDALFQTEYARSLFQTADYRAVIQLFANDAAMDANQQALLAASYQRLEEHDSAIRYYQLSLKQDSSNAKNWIGLGISQEHIAALEDAQNSYQQAAKRGNLNNRLRAFVAKRSKTLRQVLN